MTKSTSDAPETIPLLRRSKGKRPTFFRDPALDQLVSMVLELSTELYVVYNRLDTLERILEDQDTISHNQLENYKPSNEVMLDRTKRANLLLDRLLRNVSDATDKDSTDKASK